jgi:hypothetical protein
MGMPLRVSVAILHRVVFRHPEADRAMLALERTATLQTGGRVKVKARPFGGALQIKDEGALAAQVQGFRYDSERSRSDRDFRIVVYPSDWGRLVDFCLDEFHRETPTALESRPMRELREEFEDCLGVKLMTDQLTSRSVGAVVEDVPTPTENIHARGALTARIYSIFETQVVDPDLIRAIQFSSETVSDQDLRVMARQDADAGGRGRANAALSLRIDDLVEAYRSLPEGARSGSIRFGGHDLDSSIPAILEGVPVPKFRRLS